MPKKETVEKKEVEETKVETKKLEIPVEKEVRVEKAETISKAISLSRGRGGWQVTLYEIKGDKIVSKLITEPEIKQIAVEQFKIAAAKNFIMKD